MDTSYALIIINLFEMETSVNEDNFIIMWYIVADAILLLIFLIILFYSLSKFVSSYTEKLRNESFTSMVYYDSTFYDKKINNPQALSKVLREESQKTSAVGGPILAIPLLLGFSMLSSFIIAMIINQALSPILIAANILFIYIMINQQPFLILDLTHSNQKKPTT